MHYECFSCVVYGRKVKYYTISRKSTKSNTEVLKGNDANGVNKNDKKELTKIKEL